MPAEEATVVTLSATTRDADSVIKPTNADDARKINTNPVKEIIQTTGNEVNCEEEEKKNEDKQQASKNQEMENKENVQESSLNVQENTAYAAKTLTAVSDEQTKGIVVRKRRTPEKKENEDEGVSPPKKVK